MVLKIEISEPRRIRIKIRMRELTTGGFFVNRNYCTMAVTVRLVSLVLVVFR